MPPKPNLPTFEDFLQYHILLYYTMRDKHPGITVNEKKHREKIEHLEEAYKKELSKKHEDWDTEDNKQAFRREIDFLTKVFTRQKEESEKKERIQALKNKLKR